MVQKILFTALVAMVLILPLRAQEKNDPLRERVATVNVEIPVWVFADGKPVLGLKKEDFRLWEDGRPQSINGFYMVKKKIAGFKEEVAAANSSPRARYFVLAFQVYDFNDRLQEGLAHLFQKILSPQDRLLVFVNEKTREYGQVGDGEAIRAAIENDLRQQSRVTYSQLLRYFREFEHWTIESKRKMIESRNSYESIMFTNDFLKQSVEKMKEYKRKYMTQDIDHFYAFARHLEKINDEKWVISFYQREMLPSLALSSEMMQIVQNKIAACEESSVPGLRGFYVMLTQALQTLQTEARTGVDFPAIEISRFFARVHATFHSILINTQVQLVGEDLEFRQIDSGLETTLRELTEKTGGKLIASTDLVSSLSAIAEAEDIYYMLTYEPSNPGKRGKIKLQVANDKYKLQYDGEKQPAYMERYIKEKEAAMPAVRISGMDFAGRTLTFTIRDYARTAGGSGLLDVRIRVLNERQETSYDQKKVFRSGGEAMALSLDFAHLPPGKYDIVVDVLDRVSGKSCTEMIQPQLL